MTTTNLPARERLIEAAIDAFAEKGFAATTTRDIASRAGMSPAAVYVHHASKEELLFEISRRGHEGAINVIARAASSSDDPVQRIQAMVHAFSHWHAEHGRVGRIVHNEFHALTPEHRAEIAQFRRSIEDQMRAALSEGVEAGVLEVDDVKGTALALLSLSIDLIRWFVPGGAMSADDIADLHTRLATKLILP